MDLVKLSLQENTSFASEKCIAIPLQIVICELFARKHIPLQILSRKLNSLAKRSQICNGKTFVANLQRKNNRRTLQRKRRRLQDTRKFATAFLSSQICKQYFRCKTRVNLQRYSFPRKFASNIFVANLQRYFVSLQICVFFSVALLQAFCEYLFFLAKSKTIFF